MKILAVSMLRVGDLIMHENVLLNLLKENPEAELHLLVNDVSERYAKTVNFVKKIHVFDRMQWQKCLLEENRPLLGAYRGLSQLVQELNDCKFDKIINLTHTKISARLLDLIQASKEKLGMCFHEGKCAPVNNNWQRFMNDNFSRGRSSPFHYVDILNPIAGNACPISLEKVRENSPMKFIALQALTSDPKKNWPLKNFLELALLLKHSFADKEIIVLAAPGEESTLRPAFENVNEVSLRIAPWNELKSILQETALLVTGDTSVQHLAAQSGVPVLSLFLGAVCPERTSPYCSNAIVLHGSAELSVEDVFATAQAQLQQTDIEDLKLQSHVYRTLLRSSGFHFLKKLGKGTEMINIKRALEQTVWQIYLDKGHQAPVGPFGSSSFNFIQEFSREIQSESVQTWLKNRFSLTLAHFVFLEQLEVDFRRRSVQAMTVHFGPTEGFRSLADIIKSYLFRRTEGQDYFFNLEQELESNAVDFPGIQKIRQAFYEAKYLIQIESQFLKSLLQEMKERGVPHVSGSRNLFDSRIAAP
jgi:ADP-heptose:LPS heptosyltransferase